MVGRIRSNADIEESDKPAEPEFETNQRTARERDALSVCRRVKHDAGIAEQRSLRRLVARNARRAKPRRP